MIYYLKEREREIISKKFQNETKQNDLFSRFRSFFHEF